MKVITTNNIKFRVIPVIINKGIYVINENDDLSEEEMSSDKVFLFNDMTEEQAEMFVEKGDIKFTLPLQKEEWFYKDYETGYVNLISSPKESLKSLLITNSVYIKAWIKERYYPSQKESEETQAYADESYGDMLRKASDDLLLIKY